MAGAAPWDSTVALLARAHAGTRRLNDLFARYGPVLRRWGQAACPAGRAAWRTGRKHPEEYQRGFRHYPISVSLRVFRAAGSRILREPATNRAAF